MVKSEITTAIYVGKLSAIHILYGLVAIALWVNWFAMLRLSFRVYNLESDIIGMQDLVRRVRVLETDQHWRTLQVMDPDRYSGNTVTP